MRAATAAVGIALACGFGWWIHANLEPVTERVWVGFRGEAQRNPFLAAEAFLARTGSEVSIAHPSTRGRELPPQGVAVAPAGRQSWPVSEFDRVFAWIEQGGHLIVQAERSGIDDPILNRLEFAQMDPDALRRSMGTRRKGSAKEGGPVQPAPSEAPDSDADGDTDGSGPSLRSDRRLADLELPQVGDPIIVDFGLRPGFDVQGRSLDFGWRDRRGTHLASVHMGKGRVTVLSAMPFTNANIERLDHAGLLYHLVRLDARAGAVRFFEPGERQSLWRWLVEHAPHFLVALAALIVLWVWRMAVRFGPIAADPPAVRRRLLDHLSASGRFQWRHGNSAELVRAARDQALEAVKRVSPAFDDLERDQQVDRLRSIAALSTEDAQAALRAQPDTAADMMHLVRLYQRVHAALRRRPPETQHEAIV